MSDICDTLTCEQSAIRTDSLFLDGLLYWTPDGILKQPVLRASLYAEADAPENLLNCNSEIKAKQLLRMLFTSGKKIRVVVAGELFESLDCGDEYTIETLFRMAVTRTEDGCYALRIHEMTYDETLDCNDNESAIMRVRSAFYFNADKTKTSLGVVLSEADNEGLFLCADYAGGISIHQIIARLFILKKEGNYFPPLSYA